MKNTGRIKTTISIICIVVIAISLFIWTFNKQKEENRWFAVFVPGVMANSPVYSMLAEGVSQAVLDYNENNNTNYKVEVIEAGTNQAEWGAKLTGLAAMKKFEVIFSSNPSIPDLAASITEIYPEQKFIILDSFYEGNPNIATVRFNQREQSYLAGYAAGLATTSKDSKMEFSNPQKKIALISAQEYPVMNEIILPGFIEGAKAVDNGIEVIFKIVGNWYDANKGAEIARCRAYGLGSLRLYQRAQADWG
jgi:simple sugar transport system substrate-binding protein